MGSTWSELTQHSFNTSLLYLNRQHSELKGSKLRIGEPGIFSPSSFEVVRQQLQSCLGPGPTEKSGRRSRSVRRMSGSKLIHAQMGLNRSLSRQYLQLEIHICIRFPGVL